MRTRGPNPFPWASSEPSLPLYIPLVCPWAQAVKWYHRVKTWTVSAHIVDNSGTDVCNFTGELVFWNQQNNADLPADPGFPADEQQIAIGWEIREFQPDPGSNFTLSFFSSFLAPFPALGKGIKYSDPASDAYPFFQIIISVGFTDPTGTSAVTCTVDGVVVPFNDGGGGTSPWTGFITMDPDTFWENRKSDGSAPVWTAAGVQLLDPHQTDELPSSS